MPNLQNIIAENEREISSVLESFDIREYEGYLEAREEIKKKVHSSQLRLIEGFREMVDKDLEVVLEFVERYNKNDAEKEVAQSALSLKNIKEELNNNEENDNKSF